MTVNFTDWEQAALIALKRRLMPEERFWAKVNRDGPIPPHRPELGNCWVWTGGVQRDGYGRFHSENGRDTPAHRYAFALTNGAIPDGWWVLHRCDNPACVRPDHLFLGTPTDNVRDMYAKHRQRVLCGSEKAIAKATEQIVLAIRERYASGGITQRQLAREYGLSEGTVADIVRGATWKHVAGPRTRHPGYPPPRREGECHPNAKLTEVAVARIRATDFSQHGSVAALARELGVTATAVQRVRDGRAWQGIPRPTSLVIPSVPLRSPWAVPQPKEREETR